MNAASANWEHWPLMLVGGLQVLSVVLFVLYLILYEDSFFGRLLNFFLISIPGFGVFFYFLASSSCRRRGTLVTKDSGSSEPSPEEW